MGGPHVPPYLQQSTKRGTPIVIPGGGNSKIFYFHLETWGRCSPILTRSYFSGWVETQPPTSYQRLQTSSTAPQADGQGLKRERSTKGAEPRGHRRSGSELKFAAIVAEYPDGVSLYIYLPQSLLC